MGMFIKVDIKDEKCSKAKECGRCRENCPVDIFVIDNHYVTVNSDNEDECTLCDLCLNVCPYNLIAIKKQY